MESYGRFAGVYDVFMDNVNYREWADYIKHWLRTGSGMVWFWSWDVEQVL